jgi:Flp pilus assembly pilin Flp
MKGTHHGWLRRWLQESDGQDLIEYAFLAGFISLTAIAGVRQLEGAVGGWYDTLGSTLAQKQEQALLRSGGPRLDARRPDAASWEADGQRASGSPGVETLSRR